MSSTDKKLDGFRVPLGQRLLTSLVHGAVPLWKRLSNLESHSIRDRIDAIEIRQPIYISGLARSGSTVLLEIVSQFKSVATHRYRDFWTIYTPYWLGQVVDRQPRQHVQPVERSHGDRIKVTPDSPEAIEEVLWMAFFSHLHDPSRSNVLDESTSHAGFEQFYSDHLRKLLLARERCRYASKGNYNVTRFEFLLKMFPDARFIVPIRSPREHIASLRKQHDLFTRAAVAYPESVKYLDRVGHFEFGQHRKPVHTGDDRITKAVAESWRNGEEVRGWARYWSSVYGFLADQMEANPCLFNAIRVVRYEDLCTDTMQVLTSLFDFCELKKGESIIEDYESRLTLPDYYRAQFTPAEEDAIAEETSAVARRFGYLEGCVATGGLERLEPAIPWEAR